MSLRPLGWMATLFASADSLFLYYAEPSTGRTLAIMLAVAGLAALSVLVLLDVLQRRDLDARQKLTWGAIGLLSPVGPGIYYVMRRRIHKAEAKPRERLPSAYRVHDPFHRH
jgi:hypothetical protein